MNTTTDWLKEQYAPQVTPVMCIYGEDLKIYLADSRNTLLADYAEALAAKAAPWPCTPKLSEPPADADIGHPETFEITVTIDVLQDSLPLLTPTILEAAAQREMAPLEFALGLLYEAAPVRLLDMVEDVATCTFVPGRHTIGNEQGSILGPLNTCDIMIIGKAPTSAEAAGGLVFKGKSYQEMFEQLPYDLCKSWYLTHAVKFCPPGKVSRLRASWVKTCKWFLLQEIYLCKPKYIITLGAEALAATIPKTKMAFARGNPDLRLGDIRVLSSTHPSAVLKSPAQRGNLERDIAFIVEQVRAAEVATSLPAVEYQYVVEVDKFQAIVDDWIQAGEKDFCLDCEWGGHQGSSYMQGGQLRTIQLSVAPYTAVCLVLRTAGLLNVLCDATGEICDVPEQVLSPIFRRLLCREGVALSGHAVRGDILWLERVFGLDLSQQLLAGFDTALAYHWYNPVEGKDARLENVAFACKVMHRYDLELRAWVNAKPARKARIVKHGYMDIPDEVLLPYACGDVDAVARLVPYLKKKLRDTKLRVPYDIPSLGLTNLTNMLEAYQAVPHRTGLPLNKIERTGFLADKGRMLSLIKAYAEKYASILQKFRDSVNWPEFNPRSCLHVRELLFGFPSIADLLTAEKERPRLVKRIRKTLGWADFDPEDRGCCIKLGITHAELAAELKACTFPLKRACPEHVQPFCLTPVKSTGSYPTMWEDIDTKERGLYEPSTDEETLSILAGENNKVAPLALLRGIDQVIKNYLREPGTGGLYDAVDSDGRIRTSISQLTETGRYRASNPNLLALPNKQEVRLAQAYAVDEAALLAVKGWTSQPISELKAAGLLDPEYYAVRSCLTVKPGDVLIECDYVQAELWVLAILSGDKSLLDAVLNPERDMHSEIALQGLNLGCEAHEVKKLFPAQRTAAKAVVYGLIYGRGLMAIVRQMQKEGIDGFTLNNAKALKEALFGKCPQVDAFIQRQHAAVMEPAYVETPFGRRKYFPHTGINSVRARQQRQAVNMPIQGTVADLLSLALINLYNYQQIEGCFPYEVLLPVHDAIFASTHWSNAEKLGTDIIPFCMTTAAEIPGYNISLKVDLTAYTRWGEKLSLDTAIAAAQAAELENGGR